MPNNSQAPLDRPLRVCFLVRQLNTGGAQRQLIELVRSLDRSRFRPVVLSMYSGGEFWHELTGVPGVCCVSLSKKGRWDIAEFLWRFATEIKRLRPDIIQGWVGVCNLLASAARAIAPSTRVIWSIRCAPPDLTSGGWLSRAAFRTERLLSRNPDLIISNSETGKEFYVGCGFPSAKIVVVRNGIDTTRFRPNPEAGARMRAEWGVAPGECLIVTAGRLHPQKRFPLFLEAAARAAERSERLRFAIVGDGPEAYVESLKRLARDLDLSHRVIWAGAVRDMVAAYNAADVFTLCSAFEGFPNVLCEAMACGAVCAAVSAGDSGYILGTAGLLIDGETPEAIAEAWLELLARSDADRIALGVSARQRIQTECGTEELARKTAEVLEQIA
jgi:glycosyltransferase involved in cell wall biosynthesis